MSDTTIPTLLIIVEFIVILVLSVISSERRNSMEELEFQLKNTQSVYNDYAEKLNTLQMDYDDLQKRCNWLEDALEGAEKECLRLRKINLQNKYKNK